MLSLVIVCQDTRPISTSNESNFERCIYPTRKNHPLKTGTGSIIGVSSREYLSVARRPRPQHLLYCRTYHDICLLRKNAWYDCGSGTSTETCLLMNTIERWRGSCTRTHRSMMSSQRGRVSSHESGASSFTDVRRQQLRGNHQWSNICI